MRPVNLFLTERGVLKLGYYGLTTQAECYYIKEPDCDEVRSFAPEVFKGRYGIQSDVWSLGIVLIEMMGITPYAGDDFDYIPTLSDVKLPFDQRDIKSEELVDFLKKGFQRVNKRWSVNELMNVSGMGWRMMSSIHL